MRRAHGGGIADHGKRRIQRGDGDLKRRAVFGREHIAALAVHEHIVIVAAAPDDGGGHFAVRDRQRTGRLDVRLAAAALERHGDRVGAVDQRLGGRGGGVFLQNGVRHGDLVVVPLALRADDGDVELLVQRGHGDIKAIDLLAQAVGIGDGVGRGLQERRAVLLRILRRAAEEVQNALGRQADVDRHLPVFDRQRTLALACLVHVEHAAVGIEVRGVNAVGERRLGVGVLRIAVPAVLPAAEKQRAEHQHGQYQCQCSFHWEVPPSGKGSEAVHNRFEAPF